MGQIDVIFASEWKDQEFTHKAGGLSYHPFHRNSNVFHN